MLLRISSQSQSVGQCLHNIFVSMIITQQGWETMSDNKQKVVDAMVSPVEPQTISYDDFCKVDIRTGTIVGTFPIPKSNKLLGLKVDIGEAEPRTILAGIAKNFSPDQLIGVSVLVVANLAPRA